jgi:large subunit ribosomal protein L9
MKVILTQTVPKVGKQGQVVKVADGFARNYLFPRGLAILADKKQLAVVERFKAKVSAQDASTLEGAESLRDKLNGSAVQIQGKAGHETTKLFGAVTAQDIADAIKAQLGVELDRKKIALIDPIKRLGDHYVHIDIHREVDIEITVNVFDPAQPQIVRETLLTPETEEAAAETVTDGEVAKDSKEKSAKGRGPKEGKAATEPQEAKKKGEAKTEAEGGDGKKKRQKKSEGNKTEGPEPALEA